MNKIDICDWNKPMWSKLELAHRWNCTTATIDNYAKSGIIRPCRKVGRNNLYKLEDILAAEETSFNALSPMEKRRLERENRDLKEKLTKYISALDVITIATSKCRLEELGEVSEIAR